MNKRCKNQKNALIAGGYGLLLLIVFLLSSVLIATSMSQILIPSTAQYLNGTQAKASANQVALYGLDAAQSDILSQLGNGNMIDTTYRFPASGTNIVSIPTYPSSGANSSVGSYYVTVTKARGYTYILQAIASAGSATVAQNRLVQLNVAPSIYSGAFGIYSLRKVVSTYTGSAVRLRCASTSTTMDIGFTGSGDFDLTSLRACLGDSTLPLDVTTGEKLAYGLRKLSNSYAGSAIKVRRSSDNATQDIGFDANGNLDTASLLSFIGSSSGYLDTWYDQSGSGKNVMQATTGNQPRIVNSGVVDTVNNAPAVYFDGSNDSMSNTTLGGALITGSEIRAFLVSTVESGGSNPNWGEFATLWKSGDSDAYSTSTSMEFLCMINSTTVNGTHLNGGEAKSTGVTPSQLYQYTTYHDASNNLRLYRNGTLANTDTGISANLAPTSIILGTSAGSDANTNGRGYISELLVFNASVSAANQQSIEKNQGHYFNVLGLADGFVTTWYDQSGNSRDLAQATTSAQPTISTTSIKPAVFFNGTASYIENTAQNTTTDKITGFAVAQISNTGTVPSNGRIVSLGKTGDVNDSAQITSTALILKISNQIANARNNNLQIATNSNYAQDFQATVLFDGTNRTIREKQGSNYTITTTTSGSGNLVINNIRAGYSFNSGGATEYWKGKIYEIMMFPTNLSTTNYQTVESAEQVYFGI